MSFYKVCACVCVCVMVCISRDAPDNEDGFLITELDLEFFFSVSVAKVTDKRHKRSDVTCRDWKGMGVS